LVHRDPREHVPRAAFVVANHRVFDAQRALVVVAHEEDGRAIGVHAVVLDARAAEREGHGVAVVVDGPAAAAARGAGLGGIAAPADGAIVGKKAVDDGPRHADAADAAAVRADVAVPLGAAEGAVHHVDG